MARGALQRQALLLYLRALRVIAKKPHDAQPEMRAAARVMMERGRGIPRKEILTIEHTLRQSQRHLDMLQQPSITSLRTIQPR